MMASRFMRTAVAVVLVASLCVPAAAMAAPKAGKGPKPPKPNQGVVQGQGKPADKGLGKQNAEEKKELRDERKLQNLTNRIERILAQRKAKFDRAEALLQRRIDRLTAIASRAETMGVDVTEAKAALADAQTELGNAATEEDEAADLFKAVLTASDKRAAFAAARAQARVAQKALQRARLQVVRALRLLHQAVDESQVWSPNASPTVSPEAPEAPEETGETTP